MSNDTSPRQNFGPVNAGQEPLRAPMFCSAASMPKPPYVHPSSEQGGGYVAGEPPAYNEDGNAGNSKAAQTMMRRFDGDEFIDPGRPYPWASKGQVYSDPQASGSVIGKLPAFDEYGEISRLCSVNSLPMQQNPNVQEVQPPRVAVQQQHHLLPYTSAIPLPLLPPPPPPPQQQQQQQHQHQQRQHQQRQPQQLSYQMRGFLENSDDYQHFWRAHGGRKD